MYGYKFTSYQLSSFKLKNWGHAIALRSKPAPTYKPSPVYKPAPAPTYKPVPTPRYQIAHTPAYKPAPTPAYKPEPTPAYKPTPASAYKPTPAYKPVPTPAYKPAPLAYKPAPVSYKKHPTSDKHVKYDFQYGVANDYSGLNYAHNEVRDGHATNGGYSVLLPDGRTQTVTYSVGDAYSGFVADVTYTGKWVLKSQPFSKILHISPQIRSLQGKAVERLGTI